MFGLGSLLLVKLTVEIALNYQTLWFVRSALLRIYFLDKVVIVHIQNFHVVILSLGSLSFGLLFFVEHVVAGRSDLVPAADLDTLILSTTAFLLARKLFPG